jgi:hypothetical protein
MGCQFRSWDTAISIREFQEATEQDQTIHRKGREGRKGKSKSCFSSFAYFAPFAVNGFGPKRFM